jgi:hypothetical protein
MSFTFCYSLFVWTQDKSSFCFSVTVWSLLRSFTAVWTNSTSNTRERIHDTPTLTFSWSRLVFLRELLDVFLALSIWSSTKDLRYSVYCLLLLNVICYFKLHLYCIWALYLELPKQHFSPTISLNTDYSSCCSSSSTFFYYRILLFNLKSDFHTTTINFCVNGTSKFFSYPSPHHVPISV